MRTLKSQSTRFGVAANMPPLKHQNGDVFDYANSDVCNWLMAQPSIRKFVFDKANQSGLIKFNPNTRTWQGRDFKEYQF